MTYYYIEKTVEEYPDKGISTVFITSNRKKALGKFEGFKEECSIKRGSREYILYEYDTYTETSKIADRCDDY